jgi:outer membrane protein TolC
MDTRQKAALEILLVLGVSFAAAAWGADAVKPLTLAESIGMALSQSVLIHSAKEGVRGAEARRKEAFTAFLPRFSTTYGYTRLNEDPYFVFPGVPPMIPGGNMQTGTKDNYTWSVEARQPLFAGGGIRAGYEASRLAAEIARMEETATIQEIVREVKTAYFIVLKAERTLAVAHQSLESLLAHRDTAQGFFNEGLIPRNDLLSAEVELANGRQFLLRAENGLEMARAKFNSLLRQEINAPVQIEDILQEQSFATPLEACLAEALERRPEIRGQMLRVEQAKSQVKVSQSEYYPSVSLGGTYARYGDTPSVSGSPYRPQENWSVAAAANWNFWEWGKTKHRVDADRSRENQAADGLSYLRDQIVLEVKNAFLLVQEANRQVRVSQAAITQAEENFRITTERYQEQVGTATEVLDAQTLLTKARADHFNALGDVSIHRARLERAMGVTASERR